MICDNETNIFLANNPSFHEGTKHIEIDCHVIRHHIIDVLSHMSALLIIMADILTKGLSIASYDTFSCKLGMFNISTPA